MSTEAKITALQSEMDGKLAAQKTYLEALVNALSSSVTTDITAIRKQIEEINEAISKNAKEIEKLRGELAEQKEEITEAYTAAIAAAIAESEGKMSDKLAEEIAAINERIDKSDIAAIEALIANCKARMETAEADIVQLKSDVLQLQIDVEELQEITEKLLAQIQSITYIPTYDDGKATIDYHTKRGTLDFQISPKSAINDLEKVWQTALSVKAVATQTRAVEFINLPITAFEADATNGTISIEVDGSNLGDAFYNLDYYAACALCFDDGKNEKNSPYLQMTSTYIQFEDDLVESICIKNWDTNKDGKLSFAEAEAVSTLGTVFSSSSSGYKNIESFNELQYFTGVTSINSSTFASCSKLRSIVIPDGVTSIGEEAFYYCSSLESITIPEGITSIGEEAFYHCSSLESITIPEGITEIPGSAFSSCSSLKNVKIPNGVTSIGKYAFSMCSSLASITIPNSVTSIGKRAFESCTGELNIDSKIISTNYYDYSGLVNDEDAWLCGAKFDSILVGRHVTAVGNAVFCNINTLKKIKLSDSVVAIGIRAFDGCPYLEEIYSEATTPPTISEHSFGTGYSTWCNMYVPTNSVESYRVRWSEYAANIVEYDFE